jgi:hypothetical protein
MQSFEYSCLDCASFVSGSDGGKRATKEMISPVEKPGSDIAAIQSEQVVYERDVAEFPAVNTPGTDVTTLQSEQDLKRASDEHDGTPTAKRPCLSIVEAPASIGNERSPPRPQLPDFVNNYVAAGTTEELAPIAPMMPPYDLMPSMQLSRPFGMVHSDRIAQIGQPSASPPPSPPVRHPLHGKPPHPTGNLKPGKRAKNKRKQPNITGSNTLEVRMSRAINVETDDLLNGFGQSQSRPIPGPFMAQLSSTLQGQQSTVRPQTNQTGDLFPSRSNAATAAPHARLSDARPVDARPNEEARLSSSLQYCKTLFEDILEGRNPVNAAKMGVTAIQHALGKD